MPLTHVNWRPDAPTDTQGVEQAARTLPWGARVTFLIHGFRFDPAVPAHSPHTHILSLRPRPGCWKALSWPRHLHLDRDAGHLGLAFGWPATGSPASVATRAFEAGAGLAELVDRLHRLRPDLSLSFFAHSLGARVALRALSGSPAGSISRVILMSGAEYRDAAQAALETPAGRAAQIVNIRTAENLPFDLAFRLTVPAPFFGSLPLSAGLQGFPNWTDLRIDCPRTRRDLRALGHRLRAPRTRFCHWSGYLRPGLFALYRRILDPSDTTIIAALKGLRAEPHRPSRIGGAGKRLSPL